MTAISELDRDADNSSSSTSLHSSTKEEPPLSP
jgi:hypothetical protein